jgi:tryptophan 2,3-dioxygenase
VTTPSHDKAVTYTTYLKIDELLSLQQPLSDGPEHDELLFITIHQVYELWFHQMLHELAALQPALESGDTHRSLSLLNRVRTIMKICVAQLDVLETMTPLQFTSFRARLSSASGFQSAQFRELEAVLGRRDLAGESATEGTGMKMAEHLVPGSHARRAVEAAMARRSVWDSTLHYCHRRGHTMPEDVLNRDVSVGWQPREDVQEVLVALHHNDPESAMVCEALVDLDEGVGEWRYRHVMMVKRTIGTRHGTGGSSGVGYLASTLFQPFFPDLWDIRRQL